MQKLLTTKEVAKILNCHPQSVYRNQEIPRIELPGIGIRFRESDIDNLIDQRTTKPILNLTPPLFPSSIRLENLAEFEQIGQYSRIFRKSFFQKIKTFKDYSNGDIFYNGN